MQLAAKQQEVVAVRAEADRSAAKVAELNTELGKQSAAIRDLQVGLRSVWGGGIYCHVLL